MKDVLSSYLTISDGTRFWFRVSNRFPIWLAHRCINISNKYHSLVPIHQCIHHIFIPLHHTNNYSHGEINVMQCHLKRTNAGTLTYGAYFPDDIFKCILLNENVWFPIEISLKFVCKGLINNIPALVQIMAWCRPGDKRQERVKITSDARGWLSAEISIVMMTSSNGNIFRVPHT